MDISSLKTKIESIDRKYTNKFNKVKQYMSESNELLKSHSIILSNIDNVNGNINSTRGSDLDYDKVKSMINKSEKKVHNAVVKEAFQHQEELRGKIEKCVMQVTDFMRKYISSSRTINTQIKSVNNKIEVMEDKISTVKSDRTIAIDRNKEIHHKRSLTTKRTNLNSPAIIRS